MLATIPYGLIGLTALALAVTLGLIKFWPSRLTLNVIIRFKRLAYYRKRYSINRTFKKRENDIVYSTFIRSWVDMIGARDEASERYHLIIGLRRGDLMNLIQEYQPYFRKRLQYQPPY